MDIQYQYLIMNDIIPEKNEGGAAGLIAVVKLLKSVAGHKARRGRAMVGQSDLVGQEGLLVVVRVGRVGYNMVMVFFFIDRDLEKKALRRKKTSG